MKVKLLTSRVGLDFSQVAGEEIEVSEEEAKRLVEKEQAVYLDGHSPKQEKKPKEKKQPEKPVQQPETNQPETVVVDNHEARPVETLGFNKKITGFLIDAGFTTVETLQGVESSALEEIKGIGKTTAEKIVEAVVKQE